MLREHTSSSTFSDHFFPQLKMTSKSGFCVALRIRAVIDSCEILDHTKASQAMEPSLFAVFCEFLSMQQPDGIDKDCMRPAFFAPTAVNTS
jgi:hypothetical protein